jgi:hypothetical protein
MCKITTLQAFAQTQQIYKFQIVDFIFLIFLLFLKGYIGKHIFIKIDFIIFPFLVKYSLIKSLCCLYRPSFLHFEPFNRLSRILGRIFYHYMPL